MTQEEFFTLKQGDTVWHADRITRMVVELTVTGFVNGMLDTTRGAKHFCFRSARAGDLFKNRNDACGFQIQQLKNDIKKYRNSILDIKYDIGWSKSRLEALEKEMKQELEQLEQDAEDPFIPEDADGLPKTRKEPQ